MKRFLKDWGREDKYERNRDFVELFIPRRILTLLSHLLIVDSYSSPSKIETRIASKLSRCVKKVSLSATTVGGLCADRKIEIWICKVHRTVNVHSQRHRALFTWGGFFFCSQHRAEWAIGTLLIVLTTEVSGSEEESCEKPLKWVARR